MTNDIFCVGLTRTELQTLGVLLPITFRIIPVSLEALDHAAVVRVIDQNVDQIPRIVKHIAAHDFSVLPAGKCRFPEQLYRKISIPVKALVQINRKNRILRHENLAALFLGHGV